MSRPTVLYVVTEPWYFANHRLDHARALVSAGFDVHVATRRGDRWQELAEAGLAMHEIDLARGSGSVSEWVGEVRALRRLTRRVRPDVVHAVALKPVAIALSLVVGRRRPALILSVNGLGISATDGGRRLAVIRVLLRSVRRLRRVELLFQTRADQLALSGGVDRGVVIPGVGVDIDRFVPADRPATPPTNIVYLGRAVASKGLLDLADAMDLGGLDGVKLHLYCAADGSSPGSLSTDDLERLRDTPGIEIHAATSEPEAVLGRAHAAVLASWAGEGVSKFVLEALACGTPVLLSAQSGSAEVIESGRTGLVFSARDPASISAALSECASWSDRRRAVIGDQCRAAAESGFSLDVILPMVVALHQRSVGLAT